MDVLRTIIVGIEFVVELAKSYLIPILQGDDSILDKAPSEIMSAPLKLKAAHLVAEAKASQKFGPRP